MSECYEILMHTPIGNREGNLNISYSGNNISGTMELLGHTQPFSGLLTGKGECKLAGTIVSLMRTIDYTASGTITENSLHLWLEEERNRFEITGKRKEGASKAT